MEGTSRGKEKMLTAIERRVSKTGESAVEETAQVGVREDSGE